ncbi:MAG: helix-turn-helix transcriptional regulator [Kineosporiaceae bacterium]
MTISPSPATGASERLVQLLFVLTRAGGQVPAAELIRVAGYRAGDAAGRRRQLARDLDQLRGAGWDIRNEAGPGEDARFRLVTGDLRFRVRFAPDEQAELQRVARVAGLPRVARMVSAAGAPAPPGEATVVSVAPDPGPLDLALHAVENRCLLRFRYRNAPRAVHPDSLHPRTSGWYLRGREDTPDPCAPGPAKLFRLDRMSQARSDEPGTALAPEPEGERVSIDPVTWHRDPPLTAEVATSAEHVPHVIDLVGRPSTRRDEADGAVVLGIPVTHRAAFRARLYELGTRVRLLGPEELRAEVRAELAAVVTGLR